MIKFLLNIIKRMIKFFFHSTGILWIQFFKNIESFTFLTLHTFYWIFISPFYGYKIRYKQIINQMIFIGVKSVFIVILVNCFMGMIMAMQTAYILRKFGALMYTGSLVGVAFARELGPLLASIVVAGRVGSSMAAELGTMKVSEEIDALEVMGINPIRFLIAPRIIAIMLMVPCLTIISDFVGMLGGFIIGVTNLNLDPGLYINKTFNALVQKDIFTGLIKSVFFAFIIGMVGCYEGFIVEGGAEGVGKATTLAVIISIVLIILSDAFFTALFYFIF